MGHIAPLEKHRMGQGGNNLQNIIAVSITALLLLFLTPVLLFDVVEESDIESACLIVEQRAKEENIDNINTILLKTKDGLQELLLEEYLISVVLSESAAAIIFLCPSDFEDTPFMHPESFLGVILTFIFLQSFR